MELGEQPQYAGGIQEANAQLPHGGTALVFLEAAPRCLSGQSLFATCGSGLLFPWSHGQGQQKDLVFSGLVSPFPHCVLLSFPFVLPLRSQVTCDSPVVSTVLFLWLWAGADHVNHCVRAGVPASTTVTKGAPQGRARRLGGCLFQSWCQGSTKELLPEKTSCCSGVPHGCSGTISESQGDLLGTKGWTMSSLLGGTCPQRQQPVCGLSACGCPTCSGADGRCHPGEESGAARGSPGTVCESGWAVSGTSYNE